MGRTRWLNSLYLSNGLLLLIIAAVALSPRSAAEQPKPNLHTCPAGQTQCSTNCVELDKDVNNCGTCGTACKLGERCSAGNCKPWLTCKGNKTYCSGRCVEVSKDVNNCGACGAPCGLGQKCEKGVCKGTVRKAPPAQTGNNPPTSSKPSIGPGSCDLGQEWCNGRCMSRGEFTMDNNNCGRCGNSCRIMSETCTGGFCGCAAGYSQCMGSCVSDSSFLSDNNNCGSCGHSCSIGESCFGGTCHKN